MTDIFDEVNQGVREDRLKAFWSKYALWFYAVIALIILGVAGFEVMRWMRGEEVERAAKVYDAAVTARERNDLPAARTGFAQLNSDKTGFSILAGHMLAGVENELTNDAAAVEQHLAAAAKADTGVMGEMALLKLGYAMADAAPLADLEKTLKPLVDKKGATSSVLARELIAYKALADGDVERAREEFEVLQLEIGVPQALKDRVGQALAILPPRATPAAPATPAPAQPATPTPTTTPPAQPGQ